MLGGPLAATQPIEKVFSKPDFVGPNAFFSAGSHPLRRGAKAPASIDGFPGGNGMFGPRK